MSRLETTATAPALTRALARVLPSRLRTIACLGVHTIPAGYGDCAVCGRNWTRGRHWLRFHGTRSPARGRGQPSETTMHLELIPRLALHRISGGSGHHYWIIALRHRGQQHQLQLRPTISFHHRNLTREHLQEQAEHEWRAGEEQAEAEDEASS